MNLPIIKYRNDSLLLEIICCGILREGFPSLKVVGVREGGGGNIRPLNKLTKVSWMGEMGGGSIGLSLMALKAIIRFSNCCRMMHSWLGFVATTEEGD